MLSEVKDRKTFKIVIVVAERIFDLAQIASTVIDNERRFCFRAR